MVIRKLNKYISGLFIILSLTMMLLPFVPGSKSKADDNPASWILCMSSTGGKIYNAATTDSVPYALRSKSSNVTNSSVDGFMNTILETAGFNFDKVNKKILGRSIYNYNLADQAKDEVKQDEGKVKKGPNASAPKVNPFDRFGVAGLTWSSYSGEWKYYQVDACSDTNSVSSTNYGQYYPGRKEPKATYNETANSLDPRVIQFQRGTFSAWLTAFNDLLSNFLFNIAKFVITLTIALISFSFRDILAVFNVASASGGMSGLFSNFYTGIFQPFVVIMMVFLGMWILVNAIIRHQIRYALVNGLGGSLLCLLCATIIAHNPSRWVSLPNQVATYGQALVVDALQGHGDKTDSSLCSTNVGGIKAKVSPGIGAGTQKKLEQVGENMQSEIGCKMWEVFLLRPFVQGQFGTTYSKLSAKEIKNHNTSWVGKPEVPVGKGKFRDNWALFQISAQTNAHSQLGDDTKYADDPTKNQVSSIDGTGRDWYRVVDALSNYDEKDSGSNLQTGANGQRELTDQITTLKPSKYWQAWVGNKSTDRYGVASLSILFAVIGSLGPLLFATLAAIYGIGVSLLMAVSPIFFLFGMLPGSGSQIFKGWLSSLLNVMVKKIVAAGLIILSFDLTMACMDLVNKIGWIQSVILLSILSSVMMKSRSKIFDIFATFNFGNAFNPLTPFKNMAHRAGHVGRDVAVGGASVAVGAHQAHKLGLTRREGAAIALGKQVEFGLRRTQFGRAALIANEEASGADAGREDIVCSFCGRKIPGGHSAWQDINGNFYCSACANDMNDNDEMYEIIVPERKPASDASLKHEVSMRLKQLKKQNLLTPDIDLSQPTSQETRDALNNIHMNDTKLDNQKSWISYSAFYKQSGLYRTDDGKFDFDNDKFIKAVNHQLDGLNKDLDEYSKLYEKYGNRAQSPAVPEPLKPYLNTTIMNNAWRAGANDDIKKLTENAWVQYYDDNKKNLGTQNAEERNDFIQSLEQRHSHDNDNPSTSNHDNSNTKGKAPIDKANLSGKSDNSGNTEETPNNDGKHSDNIKADKPKKTDTHDNTKNDKNNNPIGPKNPFTKK